MNPLAQASWKNALKALKSARILLSTDSDGSASRSYYAAFHAVSALFAMDGKSFSKHSSLESAVHRDLVKAGKWGHGLGSDYSDLMEIRATGDYDVLQPVAQSDAEKAIKAAFRILQAVHEVHPEEFPHSDK